MKSIRVLVLVLLASVHVFTPVSSDESVEPSNKPSPSSSETKSPTAPAAPPQTPTAAPNAAPSAAPNAAPTEAPKAAPSAVPTTPRVPPTVPQGATSKATENSKAVVSTLTPKKASSPTEASTDNKTVAAAASPATTHMDNKNNTLQPKTPQHSGNYSEIETIDIPGPDESTEKPIKAGTTVPAPASHKTMAPTPQHQNEKEGAGPRSGGDEKVPAKSDKRLWWILLPVLLVGFAAAIVLKFKCKKIHDHTETIDTGTENASFQSRPESTKDGVMLLGVKSSGGEDNAAAR